MLPKLLMLIGAGLVAVGFGQMIWDRSQGGHDEWVGSGFGIWGFILFGLGAALWIFFKLLDTAEAYSQTPEGQELVKEIGDKIKQDIKQGIRKEWGLPDKDKDPVGIRGDGK